jgi:hypothetical protein
VLDFLYDRLAKPAREWDSADRDSAKAIEA